MHVPFRFRFHVSRFLSFVPGVATLLFSLVFFSSFGQHKPKRITQDYSRYFQEYGVEGCFLLYDLKKNQYIEYNPERCQTRFLPASTYKIPNSIIGLETRVITGKDFMLKWDGQDRGNPNWNKDQDLQSAFRYSAVWFYQEVARRIGEQRMQEWVKKLKYGNQNIGGGIDQFWLSGDMRISPQEQVDFLRKLYHNQLPVSRRSMDIVRDIMVLEDTLGHTLRGKTGWAVPPDKNLGWFVGYLEQSGNVYFFATNIESGPKAPETFIQSRRAITEKILAEIVGTPRSTVHSR